MPSSTPTAAQLNADEVRAVVEARHGDPFAILGMHVTGETVVVRAMLPQASHVEVIDAVTEETLATLYRVHNDGFFAGVIPDRTGPFAYRLMVQIGATKSVIDDPYRFGPILGDTDLYLLGEGTHRRLYEQLGAHPREIDGVAGVTFAVWAPAARRVSVVGDFNDWDGRRHPMRVRSSGVWEIFLPHVAVGNRYKFELLGPHGELLPLRADPFAFASERPPATASIVALPGKTTWHDEEWLGRRDAADRRDAPIATYEVHLGSWQRAEGNRYLTYAELGDKLIPYAVSMGFTHLELMPVSEHPFDGSWGYQPVGMFAPTSRFGTPQDFATFVDRAHAAGLGVLIDWVPGHFPTDAHGLGNFDGTALYEHADPRQGFQPDWNTLVFNFGRNEVANFLIANALFWLEEYHIDGLRVDAVASMLYLDYSRKSGEWIPNIYGGARKSRSDRTSAEHEYRGIRRRARHHDRCGRIHRLAERFTPGRNGGLGFGYKWNMGWMHDTLAYMHEDPINRRYHQDQLTFTFSYAFNENFVLPLSHDEVVHGKASLLGKMPGDDWQRFANLRLLFGFMYAHPGKKLMFMGCEFAQEREWNHDRSLDWHLIDDPRHRGMQDFIRACNTLYRELPALHERDCEPEGLEWITSHHDASILAFARHGVAPDALAIIVLNFTPVVRENWRIGVPQPGRYSERLNSDATAFGGSGIVNGTIVAEPIPANGKPYSLNLQLPPLATAIFTREAS